jgi:hypothetical protein
MYLQAGVPVHRPECGCFPCQYHNIWETTGETPIEPQIKKTKMEVDRAHY